MTVIIIIYCCRAQTAVLIDKDNHITYVYIERTLVAEGGKQHHATTKSLEFDLRMYKVITIVDMLLISCSFSPNLLSPNTSYRFCLLHCLTGKVD